jgi:hypothetical protein
MQVIFTPDVTMSKPLKFHRNFGLFYAKTARALAIRNLKGLDLAVFNALGGSGNSSPTQSAISTKLGAPCDVQGVV